MIKGFKIENYKAFENAYIDIKPITILLGANSIGKSSLMQLILLLKQTLNTKSEYKSALKLNGEFINLGEPENIFRNFQTDKDFKISFKLSNPNNVLNAERYLEDIKYSVLSLDRDVERFKFINLENSTGISQRHLIHSSNLFNEHENNDPVEKIVRKLRSTFNKFVEPSLSTVVKESKMNRIFLNDMRRASSIIKKINVTTIKDTLNFLESIKQIETKNLEYQYTFKIDSKTNLLQITSLKVYSENNKLIAGISISKSKNGKTVTAINSDYAKQSTLNKFRNEISRNLEFKTLYLSSRIPLRYQIGYRRAALVDENIFSTIFVDLFATITKPVSFNFDESLINYVSPLRAFPKRYYFLDEAKTGDSLNTISGDNLAEILKENPRIKKQVNDWLETFGFEVEINKLRDIIHNLKVKQAGIKLDITDVGFGLSQVLPVIVQGLLSRTNSLTLVEQPEIHLHPKMQAELADLFIDIVRTAEFKKNMLIETHSEYLLRRLRRRIAEGLISSDDVAIYFIKKDKNKSVIKKIAVSEHGAFDWPEDFYADDLQDTIAFIKNQPGVQVDKNTTSIITQ